MLAMTVTEDDQVTLDLGDGRVVVLTAVIRRSGEKGGQAKVRIGIQADESVRIGRGKYVSPNRRRAWRLDRRPGQAQGQGGGS